MAVRVTHLKPLSRLNSNVFLLVFYMFYFSLCCWMIEMISHSEKIFILLQMSAAFTHLNI